MPISQLHDARELDRVASRLDCSLLTLSRVIEQSRLDEERYDSLYTSWKRKWSTQQEVIARRLELIDSHLSRVSQRPGKSPRLAIVGLSAEVDEPLAVN
jgi:hypothetical protein